MIDQSVQLIGSDGRDLEEETLLRLCRVLRISPEDLAMLRLFGKRCDAIERDCRSLGQRCGAIEGVLDQTCCPANMNYSQPTIDKFSHKTQVNITNVVTGLGGDYVDTMPLNPGKRIRLIQEQRPGYSPVNVTVALNLANQGTNYLDLEVTFWVTTDPQIQGEQLGSEYRGFQFFTNEGVPTPIPFPTYKNMAVTIGTMNYLAIEIAHKGAANNLVSAFVAVQVNSQGWYAACGPSGGC